MKYSTPKKSDRINDVLPKSVLLPKAISELENRIERVLNLPSGDGGLTIYLSHELCMIVKNGGNIIEVTNKIVDDLEKSGWVAVYHKSTESLHIKRE